MEDNKRILILIATFIVTVASFLILLHFKISFGIALVAAMAIMAVGINYMRKDDPKDGDESE